MADVTNVKVGSGESESIMYSKHYDNPSSYRFDLRAFEMNTEANHDIEVDYNKLVIKKFKPNVWIIKSPQYASLAALCEGTKNLSVGIQGITAHSDLFKGQYYHHSVVGGSGGTNGYIRGVGIFPFSNSITGWQLSSYGQYAKNRGELPFSAYVWDALTYTDGSRVQTGSELTAFRGDWDAGYNGYGKIYNYTNTKVIPDYSTFPTPYSTLYLTFGLYTGNAVSFEAWECENRVNALKMAVSKRNADDGSTRNAYCYSGFGTIQIRVSGLSEGDRLEYGTGVIAASDSSITADGEYSITYGEGKGFILYGDTTNTSAVTIELINNEYLDEDGYVDISDNPITINLIVEGSNDLTTVECWDAYVGSEQIWHKDKTIDNCWKKYGFMMPYGWNLHRNNLGTATGLEWTSPFKFTVKSVTAEGVSISRKDTSNSNYWTVSYKAFKVKVYNKPDDVTVKVERLITNITTDEDTSIELSNGINEIEAFSKLVYRDDSSTAMTATEAKITIIGTSAKDTNFIVEIIPDFTDNRMLMTTGIWNAIQAKLHIPEVVDLTDEVMENTAWQMNPYNDELWNTIKTWYENNIGVNANFRNGNIFNGSGGLKEITIRLNSGYQYGEDNFANSDIETINFIQEMDEGWGIPGFFSAPQRLLRRAINLKNINITWADPDNPTYLCTANTIVDSMSNIHNMETYPERFINWRAYTNVLAETCPATLCQYAFDGSKFVTIPSYPGTEEENTLVTSRYPNTLFGNCTKLTTVGPTLDMKLAVPSSSGYIFQECNVLSSIKIKNLNHGDWNFDGVTRNGITHGTLKSLNADSVTYLFENLADLTTLDATRHEDTIDKSFKSWSSSYKNSPQETPDWDYALRIITQFVCRKRYSTQEEAPFIVYTSEALDNMQVYVEGLQDGDSVIFGATGSTEPIVTWSADGTQSVTKEAGTNMGFKLLSSNTDSTDKVLITIYNGLDYTNPRVSSAKLYCPIQWKGLSEQAIAELFLVRNSGAVSGNVLSVSQRMATYADESSFAYKQYFTCKNLKIKVTGLQEGDTLWLGNMTSGYKCGSITADGTYTIEEIASGILNLGDEWTYASGNSVSAWVHWGLINEDTSSTETVTIEFLDGTDDSPTVVMGNTYRGNLITSDMITAANAKGWTIYAGGVEQTV